MPVVLGNLGALVDGQAGPCMGLCMGGAWVGGVLGVFLKFCLSFLILSFSLKLVIQVEQKCML